MHPGTKPRLHMDNNPNDYNKHNNYYEDDFDDNKDYDDHIYDYHNDDSSSWKLSRIRIL